jgi:hypothetical protein
MIPMARRFSLALGLVALLTACGRAADQTVTPISPTVGIATAATVGPRRAPLPTIYPSATPRPPAEASPTPRPQATEAPETPVSFDETVVRLAYAIPSLGLERTIVGSIAAHVTVTDEATGAAVTRQNQPGVLLELQQALSELTLAELPEGCEECVRFSYALPLASLEGAGWLQDIRMLASVENYASAVLGPHFPPDTVAGLRRSATPYYPAHTVAVAADGRLWRWSAVEPQVAPPLDGGPESAAVLAAAEQVDLGEVAAEYTAACPAGAGIDDLRLGEGDAAAVVRIVCAELALPARLVPLTLLLQEIGRDVVADASLPIPEAEVPLAARIHYRRADGARLDLLEGDVAVARTPAGIAYSETLTASLVLSLSTALAEAEGLSEGADRLSGETEGNALFVRGAWTVYELVWEGDPPSAVNSVLEQLERILARLIAAAPAAATALPRTTPTPTGSG